MQLPEVKILDFWRQKYLGQAVIVFVLAIGFLCLAFKYLDDTGLKIFLSLAVFILIYLVVKEFREDLQTRGEGIILAHRDDLFGGILFDYGRGIDEHLLSEQNTGLSYQVRECFNSMKTNNFLIEEDLFYSVVSAKFLSFKHTAFEGIILTFDTQNLSENARVKAEIKQQRILISGESVFFVKKNGAEQHIKRLLELFNSSMADIICDDGKVYFWIKTNKRLFYQFSLLKVNSVASFVKRVTELQKVIENIVERL